MEKVSAPVLASFIIINIINFRKMRLEKKEKDLSEKEEMEKGKI